MSRYKFVEEVTCKNEVVFKSVLEEMQFKVGKRVKDFEGRSTLRVETVDGDIENLKVKITYYPIHMEVCEKYKVAIKAGKKIYVWPPKMIVPKEDEWKTPLNVKVDKPKQDIKVVAQAEPQVENVSYIIEGAQSNA